MIRALLIIVLLSGCGLVQHEDMQKRVKECTDKGHVPVYQNNGFNVFFSCVPEYGNISIK